jgi:hypothetical protein
MGIPNKEHDAYGDNDCGYSEANNVSSPRLWEQEGAESEPTIITHSEPDSVYSASWQAQ